MVLKERQVVNSVKYFSPFVEQKVICECYYFNFKSIQ